VAARLVAQQDEKSYNVIGAGRADKAFLLERAVNEKERSDLAPAVGIIMGSDSDWKAMRPAAEVLDELGVSYEKRVVSAHRTPDYLFEYAGGAERRGLSLIIAGAGGAAHLPGMAAAKTILPVVGVPVVATPLNGFDALLSIMQMPAGIGVATVSVGATGAKNGALFAVTALASRNALLRAKLRALRGAHPGRVNTPDSPDRVALLAQDESDLEVLRYAEDYLLKVGVAYEKVAMGPERPLGEMVSTLAALEASGVAVFIAGSRCGIGFACEIAKTTTLPVLAVPIVSEPVRCVDEFLRPFLDLPPGVATFALGKPGAINAALFAATIISEHESEVWKKLHDLRADQVKRVKAMKI
jgi:5-(carboxyamino)imidazole ribonucleotide mutase